MNVEPLENSVRFSTYSSRMLSDPAGIAEELRVSAREQGIKFDTIVGRGSSGMLIVPIVARILRKKWLIVRKHEEVQSSHDSSCKWMGELGKRWIFLDDFSSSGQTFRKVRDGVRQAVEVANQPSTRYDIVNGQFMEIKSPPGTFETELVGYFEYESRNEHGRTLVPWKEGAHPGYNDLWMDDAPWVIAQKQAEMDAMAERMRREVTDASGTLIGTVASDEDGFLYVKPTEDPETAAAPAECSVNEPGCKCMVPSSLEQAIDSLSADDKVEIRTWGDTAPITERYTTQVATYVNTQPNVIVRNT